MTGEEEGSGKKEKGNEKEDLMNKNWSGVKLEKVSVRE